MRKFWMRIRRWFRQRWDCATKQCSYYQHYQAYGPAELTHIGYHVAEQHCAEAQKRVSDWFDTHPTGEAPEHLMRFASNWEARIRA